MWRIVAASPLPMQAACEIIKIEREGMRLMRRSGAFDETGKGSKPLDEVDLARIDELREIGILKRRVRYIEARDLIYRVAQDTRGAGVGILHVEDRVVFRLLRHLGEIEIERLLVLPVEHHEADRIAPNFVDDITQCHERARPFRHLVGLAGFEEPHELYDLDV